MCEYLKYRKVTVRRLQSLTMTCLVLCAMGLGGCVVGQSLPANYEAGPAAVAAKGTAVAVAVRDERPYVRSGDKPPYFIGKYRGGFGNPWDVTTKGKQPLASLLERDLGKELQALGYSVVARSGAQRVLDVAIVDWNFDGMVDGKFWYELDAKVFGPDDSQLAGNKVKDGQHIEGSIWTGAKSGFEAKMPELYAGAIRKLVRDNPKISSALASPTQ